jgi:hypothetical protein
MNPKATSITNNQKSKVQGTLNTIIYATQSPIFMHSYSSVELVPAEQLFSYDAQLAS